MLEFCLEPFVTWFIADKGLKSEQIVRAFVRPADVIRYTAAVNSVRTLKRFASIHGDILDADNSVDAFHRMLTQFAITATLYLQGSQTCLHPTALNAPRGRTTIAASKPKQKAKPRQSGLKLSDLKRFRRHKTGIGRASLRA